MCITEYNEERHMEMEKNEGIEIGASNEKIAIAINMLSDGTISYEKISQFTKLPIEKVKELAESKLVST